MTALVELQTSIRDRFRQKPAWEALADSEMVGQMSDLLGALFFETLQEIESARTDSFLSLATSRQAVLAHAADRGYLPPRPRAPRGAIRLENTNAAAVTVPEETRFLDTEGRSYYTLEAVTIPATAFAYVEVEHRNQSEFTIVGTGSAYQEFRIADWSMVSFDVWIRTIGDTNELNWQVLERVEDFWSKGPEDWAYQLFYGVEDDWHIRFGNGEFGQIPQNTQELVFRVWKTDPLHQLLAGQALYCANPLVDATNMPVTLSARVSKLIGGGYFRSTTERIRQEALAHGNLADRLVWREDYRHLLRSLLPELSFVNVWGEQEMERQQGSINYANINTVFVSAYSLIDNANLSLRVLELLEAAPAPVTVHYQFVEPEPVPYILRIDAVVPSHLSASEFENRLRDLLVAQYGLSSPKRVDRFDVGACFSLIYDSGVYGQADERTKGQLQIQVIDGNVTPPRLQSFVYLSHADFYLK